MDATVAELRSIELREMELEEEKALLRRRKLELLSISSCTRKTRKDMLSIENRKALFAGLKRSAL